MVGRRLITSQDAPVAPPTVSARRLALPLSLSMCLQQRDGMRRADPRHRTPGFSDFRLQEVISNLRRTAWQDAPGGVAACDRELAGKRRRRRRIKVGPSEWAADRGEPRGVEAP